MLGQLRGAGMKLATKVAREVVVFEVQRQLFISRQIEVTTWLQAVLVHTCGLPVSIPEILVLKLDSASVAPDVFLHILPMCI